MSINIDCYTLPPPENDLIVLSFSGKRIESTMLLKIEEATELLNILKEKIKEAKV